MPASWRSRIELAALLILILVLLYAGLAPFDVARHNGVAWRPERGTLAFDGSGIAFSTQGFPFTRGASELSLEAWVLPATEQSSREGTIVALVDDRPVPPLALSLRQGELTLRYRIEKNGVETSRAISLGEALAPTGVQHLAVTSGAGGTRVYVDGIAPDRMRSRQSILHPDDELRPRVVVGNSAQGNAGWSGEVRALALFDRVLPELEVRAHDERIRAEGPRALSSEAGLRALYVFDTPSGSRVPNLVSEDAALRIPGQFEALRWDVLTFPPEVSPLRSARFRRDILLNLLGFVPLGVLLMQVPLWRTRTPALRVLAACAVGGLLSLAIELGQAMLPTRYSSALDLMLNVAGTALGAVAVTYWRSWRVGTPAT